MSAAASFLLIAAVALLIPPPALSVTCPNATYANCLSLPTLRATLQWTHNATAAPNATLSVAFTAPPPNTNGWVGWGLNPTAPRMQGAQALVAFRKAHGGLAVKTYNLTDISRVVPSNITYDVLSMSAALTSRGEITIFATLAVPGATRLNQVWQVGPSVTGNGTALAPHAMDSANMRSTGPLDLAGGAAGAPAETPGATAAAPGAASGGGNGSANGGGARVWGSGLGLYGALVLLWASF